MWVVIELLPADLCETIYSFPRHCSFVRTSGLFLALWSSGSVALHPGYDAVVLFVRNWFVLLSCSSGNSPHCVAILCVNSCVACDVVASMVPRCKDSVLCRLKVQMPRVMEQQVTAHQGLLWCRWGTFKSTTVSYLGDDEIDSVDSVYQTLLRQCVGQTYSKIHLSSRNGYLHGELHMCSTHAVKEVVV